MIEMTDLYYEKYIYNKARSSYSLFHQPGVQFLSIIHRAASNRGIAVEGEPSVRVFLATSTDSFLFLSRYRASSVHFNRLNSTHQKRGIRHSTLYFTTNSEEL